MAKLQSDLTRIALNASSAAERALKSTAREIFDVSQMLCPVKTGALKKSGSVEFPDEKTAIVGYTAEHAPYINWGTSRMGANPFFSSAWFMNEKLFKENLEKELKAIS